MTPGIVIAGGGTAGHVYPGIALAEALRDLRPDAPVSFVGTARGIETVAVPAAGFRLHLVEVIPWSRTLGARRYLAPASLVRAVVQAVRILRKEDASVIVGMGGYASLPVVLAGRGRRLPVVLHEQNSIPGLANLVGARVARNIALVFEEARSAFPKRARIRVLGNPIRASIANLDRKALREQGRAALGLDPDAATVVIFGGSLGAAHLNEAGLGLAGRWKTGSGRQVLLITGPDKVGEVAGRVPEDAALRVIGYLERMEHAYAAADLVLSRSGATTIAELGAVGVPSILVPYPYARRGHQATNASALAKTGGAVVIADPEATSERIATEVERLLADPPRLKDMGERAKAFGKPRAAQDLAAWVLELTESRG